MGILYLETERLILRPHAPDDFEDYFAYIMNRELQRMMGLNDMDNRTSAQATFQWLLDNSEFIAVVNRDSRKVIGHICIQAPYERLAEAAEFMDKKGASLSFAIAKNEQGKGLMSEALEAFIAQKFQKDGFDYLDCEHTSSNAPSAALQKKLGFRYWGTEQLDGEELIVNVKSKP